MTVTVRANDIIEMTMNEDWEGQNTIELAKENIELLRKAVDGKTRGILSHMPNSYMPKDVMDYYKNKPTGDVGSAMIATSFGAKVLGNFFLKIMIHQLNYFQTKKMLKSSF